MIAGSIKDGIELAEFTQAPPTATTATMNHFLAEEYFLGSTSGVMTTKYGSTEELSLPLSVSFEGRLAGSGSQC
jgi:hypothetical protein